MKPNGYLAIIEKEPDSIFGVVFPDVPGCYSAGDTLAEARAMADEALNTHLELLDRLPARRSLQEIIADPDVAEILPNIVEIIEVRVKLPEAAQ